MDGKINLENIKYGYGKTIVLDQINLEIRKGELFTLLGPSGCGKTTILRMIAGFLTPLSGEVYMDGNAISHLPPEKRDVGIVFQNYALFPGMNVEENIAYGLKLRKKKPSEIREKCEHYLELMNMSEYRKRRIDELSGGQQQRVAIARALVVEPNILLLDEPLSNLDVTLRIRMRQEIRNIQKKTGVTTLFITHDQEEALEISDRIAIMNGGKILQTATPEQLYDFPVDDFVSNFVGSSNKLSKDLLDALHIQSSKPFIYRRPEMMSISKTRQPNTVSSIVQNIKFKGIYYECIVENEHGEFCIRYMNQAEHTEVFKIGDTVWVGI